jgi:hypothetical protein
VNSRGINITLALALAALAGCATAPTTRPATTQPRSLPSYDQIAERYNRNIAGLNRLWSAATVELSWKEGDKKRWEQGEGQLIVVPPDRVSLSIGKLNNTLLWAGADAERYWIFDLQGDKTAYVGKHADYAKAGGAAPLPIHPLELVRLLGITPLPRGDAARGVAVEWMGGDYLVDFPARMRLVIDPATALATRIDLLDAQGFSRVIAKLSAPGRVELENTPPGGFPTIATSFEITMTDREGWMKLHLSRLTNNHEKINERVFDFDFLEKTLKPQVVKVLK